LQRHYSFTYVYELPHEFTGIDVLNRPVVSAKARENYSTISGRPTPNRSATEQQEQCLQVILQAVTMSVTMLRLSVCTE